MTPGLLLHPTYSPALACETLECTRRHFRIDACREEGCGYRWMREGAENRKSREGVSTALNKGSHNLRSMGRT